MATPSVDHTPTSQPGKDETPDNPAETYERYMVPPLFAPAAGKLLDAARPAPGERVLDVGCGTGIVARGAARRLGTGGSVAGLDPNPDMLAVARATAAAEDLAIDWHDGRAESVPFPDGSFDLVLSQFALMFFGDRQRALKEMRRVLAPAGRLALSVWQGIEHHPFYQSLDHAIARHLGTSAVGEIFALGDADALRALLTHAGFRDIVIHSFSIVARFPQPHAFLAGEIDVDTAAIPAMQGLDPAARRELTVAIAADMAEPLSAVTEGEHVRLTFYGWTVRANR